MKLMHWFWDQKQNQLKTKEAMEAKEAKEAKDAKEANEANAVVLGPQAKPAKS